MVDQERDTILPLVITSGSTIVDVVLTNEKGYRKSVETGRLWTIHPKGGRLLPYESKPGYSAPEFLRISKAVRWYQAEIPEKPVSGGGAHDFAGTAGGSTRYNRSAGRGPAGERPNSDASVTEGHREGLSQPAGLEVVALLEAVIKERREAMPEGSYTTHLFQSGLDKIRKKTGEEAVELILAESKDDIAHESADLLYHLLVLLEAAGVPLETVLEELRNRSS